ncbi:MAG: UPF0182 family protein [Actinomycetota bacterium]
MRVPTNVPRPRIRRRSLIVTGAVLVGLLVFLGAGATFYTDLLWFRETGFQSVFTTQIWTKTYLGLAFGAIFAVFMLVNLWVVQKVTSPYRLFTMQDQVLERYRATLRPYVRWGVIGLSLLFGLFAGSGATSQWRKWLLFSHAENFGVAAPPPFGKDIGFYVFKLPFYRFLFTWGFSSLVIITLVVGAAHYFMGGIRAAPAGERVTPQVRAHMSVLLGLIVLLKAWGYRLDQLELVYSPRGQVTGGSYTDVNAQLPALKLLVIIAIVAGILFLINIRLRGWILPAAAVGILGLTSILVGGLYPALVQRFRVTPNELLRESKYIQYNIDFTRRAFGIDESKVTVRPFAADANLDAAAIQRNADTVQNIRLWDPFPLETTYTQLQRIRSYYEFADVDVDRYDVGGVRRQVMLAAREISQQGLRAEARTWLNSHLVYTHGYGVVASRVDRVIGEGTPDFLLKDIPGTAAPGFPPITEPRIYFGESQDTRFVVVRSKQQELDYPEGETVRTTSYEGKGGTQLSGILRRAAFAWRFRDFNLLISGAIKNDSRIIFRRTITERLRQTAPFLKLDGDPYIAAVGGRLVWIQDGFTTTDMYPYAERVDLGSVTGGGEHISGRANYIRNSVKATVDAMDGTITLYIIDESDPIVRAWQRIFPDIFKPTSAIPAELRAHFRYPEDMFKVQADRFTTYHITQADEFYAKEDAWRVPGDPTNNEASFPPYYVIQRLPEEKKAAFILMMPFSPYAPPGQRARQNMTAWLAARSDPEDYGQLISFEMPRQKLVFGPEQVYARINQDPQVSAQLSLWDRAGSMVIHGNLLVIPIEQSLLYVEPLYLQAQSGALPELKRVVVVAGETVRMGETLDQAIKAVFGQGLPAPVEGGGGPVTPGPSGDVSALLVEALRHFAAADEALRTGDFATYDREIDAARAAIEQANRQSNPSPQPSPTS